MSFTPQPTRRLRNLTLAMRSIAPAPPPSNVLIDWNFPGADQIPLDVSGNPFSSAGTSGEFQQVSNKVSVIIPSTFAVVFDSSNVYPADQWGEVTIDDVGGGDFGIALRTSFLQFYFCQNADASNIIVFKFPGFGVVGTIFAENYGGAGNRIKAEAVGAGVVTINLYKNDVLLGSVSDSFGAYNSGNVGFSGYDGAFKISRFRAGYV